MKFFFDNNLSPYYARAINALVERDGDTAVHLVDMFPRDIPDVVWIPRLSAEGQWVIITGDLRITRNAHERAVWIQSGLTTFFLRKQFLKMSFWDQIGQLVQRWPLISEQARRIEPGAGFLVSPKSRRFEQVRIR